MSDLGPLAIGRLVRSFQPAGVNFWPIAGSARGEMSTDLRGRALKFQDKRVSALNGTQITGRRAADRERWIRR